MSTNVLAIHCMVNRSGPPYTVPLCDWEQLPAPHLRLCDLQVGDAGASDVGTEECKGYEGCRADSKALGCIEGEGGVKREGKRSTHAAEQRRIRNTGIDECEVTSRGEAKSQSRQAENRGRRSASCVPRVTRMGLHE